ncbi:unnamed protein product, partial [Prunus brigantina]
MQLDGTYKGNEQAHYAEEQGGDGNMFSVCHAATEQQEDNVWFVDNGCSNHMKANKKLLCDIDTSKTTQKGYRCYHPPSQKVYTSMDVVFWEYNLYFFSSTASGKRTIPPFSSLSTENLLQNDQSLEESDRSPPLVLRTRRTCFKTTGCQRKTTSCLHAVKLRRRKLNRFMRFCPLRRILQL